VASVGVALVALAAAASSGADAARSGEALGSGAPAVLPVGVRSGKELIQVALSASGHGKFTARGVVADAGLALGEPRVSPKRVRLKITFTGVGGSFRVVVVQLCGKAGSTWTVVTGSQAYRGLSGHGTGRGRIPCGRGASHLYLSGTAKRPVLPRALPGTYRGTNTSLNLRVTFDVLATGSALTKASFGQLVARCNDSRILFLRPKFSANYPIGTDKRFSISENGYQVAGTFSSRSAQGTIAYDNGGCHMDRLSWTATTPPPPIPSAPSGRYCGFTLQGIGICLDATPDGWVANAQTSVNVRCLTPTKTVLRASYEFGGLIVLRTDLTFHEALARIPLDGGGSISWKISGRFDGNGGVSGSVAFSTVSLYHDGKLYSCRSASSSWNAQLGR
jgi:hypothetical protein